MKNVTKFHKNCLSFYGSRLNLNRLLLLLHVTKEKTHTHTEKKIGTITYTHLQLSWETIWWFSFGTEYIVGIIYQQINSKFIMCKVW